MTTLMLDAATKSSRNFAHGKVFLGSARAARAVHEAIAAHGRAPDRRSHGLPTSSAGAHQLLWTAGVLDVRSEGTTIGFPI